MLDSMGEPWHGAGQENPPVFRYIRSGEQWLATTSAGSGEPAVIWISPLLSHAEIVWQVRQFREFFERLGRIGTVVQFDRRGAGLSDPVPGLVVSSFDEWVEDALALMDGYGLKKASLVAPDSAAPYTVMFAAARPERVEKIVLIEPQVYGGGLAASPPAELREAFLEEVGRRWGEGAVLPLVSPRAAQSPDACEIFAQVERNSMSRGVAAQALRDLIRIDVSALLAGVKAPVLVAHGDRTPVRDLVQRLPNAEARYFGGHDLHWWWDDERRAELLDTMEEFLTGHAPAVDLERVLATVLFTDIVGSTDRAAAIGDAAWRRLLDRHDSVAVAEVRRARGNPVKTTGDGILATFDSPARAVRCAEAIRTQLSGDGLEIRAAVHTGEVERRGDDIGGMTVHVAARILSHAHAGQIITSSIVRDLVVGSRIEFADQGTHELRGIPGTWSLLRANASADAVPRA